MRKLVLPVSLIWFILIAGINPLTAQQRVVEESMQAGPGEKISLNLKFGESIVVKGWEKNEVLFQAVVEINQGKLNSAFIINYLNDKQGIRIDTEFDDEKLKTGRAEDCPSEKYHSYRWNDRDEGHVVCSNILYQVFIPRSADLQLETISADVELVDLGGPISAKSISDFVDLSWPESSGAEISLKTVTGEAYTDLGNIRFKNRKERISHVGYELRGTIGTGGPLVRLESVSGDLFLRKPDGKI